MLLMVIVALVWRSGQLAFGDDFEWTHFAGLTTLLGWHFIIL